MKVVIDTNVLLVSISQRSSWHWLFRALIEERLELFVTTEILHEYEEKISQHWSDEVARIVLRTFTELSSVHLITTYFRLNLITNDPDDNKFVDCAFASGVEYLVTNDKHFSILNSISFPKINIITLQDFKIVLEKNFQ